MMVSIYILRLFPINFTLEKTTDNIPYYAKYDDVPIAKLGKRINDHFNDNGSAWTKRYKPVGIHQIHHNCVDEDEDKHTKIMMKEYGIENVRGGNYCTIELSDQQMITLTTEIIGNANRCYKCGKSGHFANRCHSKNRYSTKKYKSEKLDDLRKLNDRAMFR